MKTVLVAFEKHGIRVFDVSSDTLKARAYLKLFNDRDKDGYYHHLLEMGSSYYLDARKGGVKAAERVIRINNGHEYERTEEIEVE
jgi:hypothetical protein